MAGVRFRGRAVRDARAGILGRRRKGDVRARTVGLVRAWTWPSGSASQVRVERGELATATVALDSLRSVEGVVLTHGGQPAEGADVWRLGLAVSHDVPRPIARSDTSGRFKFWINSHGQPTLCARRGDELPSNQVTVPTNSPGTTERVEFVLGPKGQTLTVRIEGPMGEPVGNASVWVRCGASFDLCRDSPPTARSDSPLSICGVRRLTSKASRR